MANVAETTFGCHAAAISSAPFSKITDPTHQDQEDDFNCYERTNAHWTQMTVGYCEHFSFHSNMTDKSRNAMSGVELVLLEEMRLHQRPGDRLNGFGNQEVSIANFIRVSTETLWNGSDGL